MSNVITALTTLKAPVTDMRSDLRARDPALRYPIIFREEHLPLTPDSPCFLRSTIYGFGVSWTSVQHRLHRMGIVKNGRYDDSSPYQAHPTVNPPN